MDGYQLTASIIQSLARLAWPIAFVVAILLFRDRLAELLPFLRLKYKDWEISFRLREAEKEAADLPPEPEGGDEGPTQEETDKFMRVVAISPRAALLEIRAEIEEAVRNLAKASNLLTPRVQSFLGLTRLLRSRGIIDDKTSALLDDLRVIGNNAAHDPQILLTSADAIRYKSLANRVIARLNTSAGNG